MVDLTALLKITPMLCAAGGLLITAGTLLTIYEAVVRRPRTINVTHQFGEQIASGKIPTLRLSGGRSGIMLVAFGAILLAIAAYAGQE